MRLTRDCTEERTIAALAGAAGAGGCRGPVIGVCGGVYSEYLVRKACRLRLVVSRHGCPYRSRGSCSVAGGVCSRRGVGNLLSGAGDGAVRIVRMRAELATVGAASRASNRVE